MPELPEVRTVIATLNNLIKNDTILSVEVYWDKIIDHIDVDEFKKAIQGQTINDIKSKGKLIIFVLDDYIMFSHLRMEGKYYVEDNYTKDKHTHVIFKLKSNRYLAYHDVRKFGKISLIKKADYLQHPYLKKIADEPFNMSVSELYQKTSNSKKEIKPLLLDQSIMAGLGNIYVDEVLFRSKIHPETIANQISEKQVANIIENSCQVLNKAIALGGTTIRTYTSSLGVSGKFQNELLVHTKAGEECTECHHKIEKIKVKGRGTYLCPNCQKKL